MRQRRRTPSVCSSARSSLKWRVASQCDASGTDTRRSFGVVRAAVACPGDGREPLLIDVLAAVLAQAEGAGLDARQRKTDFLTVSDAFSASRACSSRTSFSKLASPASGT